MHFHATRKALLIALLSLTASTLIMSAGVCPAQELPPMKGTPPETDSWRKCIWDGFDPGSWVEIKTEEFFSDGCDDLGKETVTEYVCTVTAADGDGVTLKVVTKVDGVERPAIEEKIAKTVPGVDDSTVLGSGTEKITVAGTDLECRWNEVQIDMGHGFTRTTKQWTSDEVPGRIVKSASEWGNRLEIHKLSFDVTGFKAVQDGPGNVKPPVKKHPWAGFKPGSFCRTKTTSKATIQGTDPMTTETTMSTTLVAIDEENATVRIEMEAAGTKLPGSEVKIPLKSDPAGMPQPNFEVTDTGTEVIRIGDRPITCDWKEVVTQVSGNTVTTRMWTSQDVPGFNVKMVSSMAGNVQLETVMELIDYLAVFEDKPAGSAPGEEDTPIR
jgi:hypothetical protein